MRAILGFVAFVAVIIFLIIVIVRGGNEPEIPSSQRPALVAAASSDAVFSYTTAGPISANEDFYRIKINVSRASRSVQVYRGYGDTVVAAKQFDNNTAAFGEFLSALDRAGYTSERRTSFESEAGLCPNGLRMVFESDQFDEAFRRWTTNCKERGSFGGSIDTVSQLYIRQIPGYSQFIAQTRNDTGLGL